METKPQALDWKRLNHIGTGIVWEAATYRHFKDPLTAGSAPAASGREWVSLPFEKSQVDKLPQGGGIYALAYIYKCLGFPEQEIIMYVGEAENLRSRLGNHIDTAQGTRRNTSKDRSLRTHKDRLSHLFLTFEHLTMRYCAMNLREDQRLELERNLISLLDPPFNWKHRPRPTLAPTIGRPGSILTKPGDATPAFGQQNARRTQ